MLTPDQAKDLVTWAGSQRAAARAVDVPRTTFQGWLNPEHNRRRLRRRYSELSGADYNALLLRHRRNKALARMAEREQRRSNG